ncbi:putative glutamate receptor [Haemaphysalis longicornis]
MATEGLLRLTTFDYAPYHFITKPGLNGQVGGVCGKIMEAIIQSLRTNYSVAFPLDSFWGLRKPDGNWTGVIGMLQRDEADWALSVINPTSEKKDVAVETEIILPIELSILAGRLSRHESNMIGVIQIFPLEASNGLATTSPRLPHRSSARIVVATFWLVVIIVTTAFAGQMKAIMMVRQEADRIDSLQDLSQRPSIKPYVPAGSAVVSSIRDSKDPFYRKVWGMVEKFKTDLPPAVVLADGTLRDIMRGKSVLILSRPAMAARATEVCANSTEGELYVGRVPTFKFNAVFYLNKRMPRPLRDAINYRILWLRESGLVEKWWRESSGNWEGCGQAISDGTLKFSDFKDLLKMWLAMLGFGLLACLAEVAAGWARRIRTSRLT